MLRRCFSKGWMGEFKFTSRFANIWAGLQSWGSGCSCHEEELTSGKNIVCPLKGRRIPDAWLKVQTTLNAMNASAERFTTTSFLEATAQIHCAAAGRSEVRHSCCACEVRLLGQCPVLGTARCLTAMQGAVASAPDIGARPCDAVPFRRRRRAQPAGGMMRCPRSASCAGCCGRYPSHGLCRGRPACRSNQDRCCLPLVDLAVDRQLHETQAKPLRS